MQQDMAQSAVKIKKISPAQEIRAGFLRDSPALLAGGCVSHEKWKKIKRNALNTGGNEQMLATYVNARCAISICNEHLEHFKISPDYGTILVTF